MLLAPSLPQFHELEGIRLELERLDRSTAASKESVFLGVFGSCITGQVWDACGTCKGRLQRNIF